MCVGTICDLVFIRSCTFIISRYYWLLTIFKKYKWIENQFCTVFWISNPNTKKRFWLMKQII